MMPLNLKFNVSYVRNLNCPVILTSVYLSLQIGN